jgi:uncharacterized protein with von Willebrand factor type A (vWA) domain
MVNDYSGSMNGLMDELFNANENLISTRPPDDLISCVMFNDSAQIPFQRKASSKEIMSEVRSKYKACGGTSFPVAIDTTVSILKKENDRSTIIIFMSDGQGGDAESNLHRMMKHFPDVILHTVSLGSGSDKKTLQRLADIGNGKLFECENVKDLLEAYSTIGYGLL